MSEWMIVCENNQVGEQTIEWISSEPSNEWVNDWVSKCISEWLSELVGNLVSIEWIIKPLSK